MILETSFVIDFLRGKENAKSKMDFLISQNILLEIVAPTVFELYAGIIQLGKSEEEIQKITSLLKGFSFYPLDEESARIAGIIDGKLIKNGLKISAEDSMIAGIAIKNNKKVLTRDEHFKRIEGLKIESY